MKAILALHFRFFITLKNRLQCIICFSKLFHGTFKDRTLRTDVHPHKSCNPSSRQSSHIRYEAIGRIAFIFGVFSFRKESIKSIFP